MFLLPQPTNRLTCETTQRPNPFYLGLTRHDERNDRLYDPRYFLLFECYLAEFRVSVPHSALTLLPRCRTDVLPSCLSLSLPYVARQEPAPAGKPSSPQLSVFISSSPCPHVPSSIRSSRKDVGCTVYSTSALPARSVQRNFFHVICTRGPLTPMPSIQGQKCFIPLSGCLGSPREEYYAVYHSTYSI